MYGAASARQQLTRAAVRKALASGPHGFTPLDACLLRYSSLVNDAYDRWYVSWARAVQVRRTASFLPCNLACRGRPVHMHSCHASVFMHARTLSGNHEGRVVACPCGGALGDYLLPPCAPQGNETAKRLAKDDKEGRVPKELFNHYTIISTDAAGNYTQAAYAAAFPREIGAILDVFDKWVAGKRPPAPRGKCPSLRMRKAKEGSLAFAIARFCVCECCCMHLTLTMGHTWLLHEHELGHAKALTSDTAVCCAHNVGNDL